MPADPFRGRRWADHRRTLEAIARNYRTCLPWRDLPEELGSVKTAHKRLIRWAVDGTWERILAAVLAAAEHAWRPGRAGIQTALGQRARSCLRGPWRSHGRAAQVGFFTQRDKYQAGIDANQVLPPAKTMEEMHTIVTNSTVDGILSALFAVLIVVVLADAATVCVKSIRAPEGIRLAEVPYVESKLVAPAGLIPTREEKAELAAAGTGGADRAAAGSGKA